MIPHQHGHDGGDRRVFVKNRNWYVGKNSNKQQNWEQQYFLYVLLCDRWDELSNISIKLMKVYVP